MIEEKLLELRQDGYCVLRAQLAVAQIEACREALWPVLLRYVEDHGEEPNRGPGRHFMPMPFEPPCFQPDFFFDPGVLAIVRGAMDDRVVADQWGCDVPVLGSGYQEAHVDYGRPLFADEPELLLPVYMLVVSFGLARIRAVDGPIEMAPGTHRVRRDEAARAVAAGEIAMRPVPLEVGDVLIRHPWALHRGTPNRSETPRALVTVRYVRRWYADASREVNAIPRRVWKSLTAEQRALLRFPVGD